MPWHVQEGIDLGDGHGLWPGGYLDDLITSLDSALLQHAEVEPRSAMGNQHGRDARVFHADTDPVARDPGLGYLEDCLADAVPVADAYLIVCEALDGEVLAELAVDEVVAPELVLPVAVRLDLVDEYRPLLAAVSGQIALAIAVDIQPPHQPRPVDRPLPHRRMHNPAIPGQVLRHAYVHRKQAAGRLVRDHSPVVTQARSGSDARPSLKRTGRYASADGTARPWPPPRNEATNSGLPASSAGVPSMRSSPPPSTYVRSEMARTALALCSTISTAAPAVASARTCAVSRERAMIGARFAVGSSSRNTSGESISTRPMASILRSPPDSFPAGRRSMVPSRGKTPSTCSIRPGMSPRASR